MAERFVLSSPIIVTPPMTDFVVHRFDAFPGNNYLLIAVRSNTGKVIEHIYRGDDAIDKFRLLRKANFSIKSLDKWIIEFMAVDSLEFRTLSGTVQGSPD